MADDKAAAPRLAELCWKEFRDLVPARCDGVIIPIGKEEAHGGIPHGTDIIIPESL